MSYSLGHSFYHSSITIAFGLSLVVFGFIQMALGKAVHDSLTIIYGSVFGYVSLIVYKYLNGGNEVTVLEGDAGTPFLAVHLVHLLVAAALVSGLISSRSRRFAIGCGTGIAGILIFLCNMTFLQQRSVDEHTINNFVVLAVISTLIGFNGPDIVKIFSTVVIGFGCFVDGISVVLEMPLHDLVLERLKRRDLAFVVVLPPILKLCIRETVMLAVLCAMFQLFCDFSNTAETGDEIGGRLRCRFEKV